MLLPTFSTKARAVIAAVVLLAVGGTAGVVAGHALEPSVEMAPMRPVPIRSLATTSDSNVVTIRGRVAEVFGNTFVADDGSGRALVDLGHKGDDAALVTAGQTVSVQGRFDKGRLRASFLVDGAGAVTALRPMGPPPGGERGRHGPGHGPGGGPRGDGPPPPPPAGGNGAPPPPAPVDANGATPPPPAGAAPVAPPAGAPAAAPTAPAA